MEMPEGWKRTVKKLQEIDYLTQYSPEIMTSDITDAVILMAEMAEALEAAHKYMGQSDYSYTDEEYDEMNRSEETLKKFKEWK